MNQGNEVAPTGGRACGERATVRIELYTPREGEARGRLDGVTYHCDRHADEFLEVLGWDTGDTTSRRSELHDPTILCGSGWDFVAGRAIEPAAGEEIHNDVTDSGCSPEELRLLQRIDAKLSQAVEDRVATEERVRKAHAYGYVDGVTARIEGRAHAFVVAPFENRSGWWVWHCRCGWSIVQAPDDRVRVVTALVEHAAGTEAVQA